MSRQQDGHETLERRLQMGRPASVSDLSTDLNVTLVSIRRGLPYSKGPASSLSA
ncbi:MAG: hypothetical protein ACYC5M_00815 [Anaerolineae bacterium]